MSEKKKMCLFIYFNLFYVFWVLKIVLINFIDFSVLIFVSVTLAPVFTRFVVHLVRTIGNEDRYRTQGI